ncbi:MAG: hypothetical protein E7C03_03500 [Anaerococcus sp.]|nr:hypothetical protein [Anaerococcus sp.]
MSEFKVIESQEEFDARIKDRIERAKEKAIEDYKIEIKKTIDDLKSENSSLKNEVAGYKESLEEVKGKDETIKGLNEKISAFERADVKRNIALEYGLPFKLADKISGDDEDSMKKDAEVMAKYFSESKKSYEPPLKTYENKVDEKDQALKKLLDGLDMEGE